MKTLMNDTQLALAKRLKAARLLADLEQAEIAAIVGVARQTVSNWERGLSEPGASHFVRWARATDQPLEWLAEGVGEAQPDFSSAGGVGGRREGRQYTPRDLNPEPTGYGTALDLTWFWRPDVASDAGVGTRRAYQLAA